MTIISAATADWSELTDFTWPSHVAYAKRHGYYCHHSIIPASDLPPAWRKLQLLFGCKHWPTKYGAWAWWLDADALITGTQPITDLIDPESDIVIASDKNGINTGSFLMQLTHGSKALIMAAWVLREKYRDHKWYEQAAIMQVLQEKPDICRVKHVPKRAINSFLYDWEPGDLVCHNPAGGKPAQRLKALRAKTQP